MISYLLAITPPEYIRVIVDGYREKFRKHSYSISPHITLYPPFILNHISEQHFVEMVSEKFKNCPSKEIMFDSVGLFENRNDSNVLFFESDEKSYTYMEHLFQMCLSTIGPYVRNKYGDYPKRFHPHMTISSKIKDIDLPFIKEESTRIKELLSFFVHSIDLYMQKGNSGVWIKIHQINF